MIVSFDLHICSVCLFVSEVCGFFTQGLAALPLCICLHFITMSAPNKSSRSSVPQPSLKLGRVCVSKDGPPDGGCHLGTSIGTPADNSDNIIKNAPTTYSPQHTRSSMYAHTSSENVGDTQTPSFNTYMSQLTSSETHPFTHFPIASNAQNTHTTSFNAHTSSSTAQNAHTSSSNRDTLSQNIYTQNVSVSLQDIFHTSNDIESLTKSTGNGSIKNITVCNARLCKMKEYFIPKDMLVSTVTHRSYQVVTPPNCDQLNDHSANVIYLLTCSTCHLQYVGETVQGLNERFTGHRSGIKNPAKYGSCRILSEHFNNGICSNSKYTVQLIEKLEGSGRDEDNKEDLKIKRLRKDKELKWMLSLRTVYPYGLNDRLGDEYKTDKNQKLIANEFNRLPRKHARICRGKNRTGTNRLSSIDFVNKFQLSLKNDIKNTMNFSRTSLSSMKKSSLKEVADIIGDEISLLAKDYPFIQWYLAILDFIEAKIYKPDPPKQKRERPTHICIVEFVNKAVEFINLPRIFHDKKLHESFPKVVGKFDPPTVVYKLVDPIRSKLFNFNKFVANLNISEFIQDETIVPCSCDTNPKYKDPHHNHIITGDLHIVLNNKLRKLFTKGPKYREPAVLSWDKAKEEIVESLEVLINTWCNDQFDETIFSDFKNTALELVDERITSLRDKYKQSPIVETLKIAGVKNNLKNLQDKYIIAPMDKATGNVAFICKRFYAHILAKELELLPDTGNKMCPTYIREQNISIPDVIKRQVNNLKSTFKLSTEKDMETLPHIYWLPKMHKSPIGFRFIVAGVKCTVKLLSKHITSIFKLFYQQIESYNKKCRFFSGINTFWVIQNNAPVIKSIKRINKRKGAQSISTFDFSTLYTKIPHDQLEDVLFQLTDFCFNTPFGMNIAVDDYGADWTDHLVTKSSAKTTIYSKSSIKKAITFLLSNCFFTLGDQLFRQVIGIPMGSDPAPFFANLFLYFHEEKYMKKLKKVDKRKARRYGNVFRFIDDLNSMNDGGEFERSFGEIYPPELELKKENSNNDQASFLDLDIKVNNRVFDIQLFDKRDAFPFPIVRMPFTSSNMPSSIFYSSLGAELLRIARCSTTVEFFVSASSTLLTRMRKQGAKPNRINRILNKIFGRHPDIFTPMAHTAKGFCGLFELSK